MDFIKEYIKEMTDIYSSVSEKEIIQIIKLLDEARNKGKTIFTMGNGGSASNASHFVNSLTQGANAVGKARFSAISLTDNIPNLLAYGNDYGYEHIFDEQLKNLLKKGDIVIGISGSGNSKNVLNAIEYAKNNGAITIGFCGFNGGKLKDFVDYKIHVKSDCMEVVEDIHLSITHLIACFFKNKEKI
jgi:D-sedoheptulose 7-phosphate isomerase